MDKVGDYNKAGFDRIESFAPEKKAEEILAKVLAGEDFVNLAKENLPNLIQ
jgi:hypothetical protein